METAIDWGAAGGLSMEDIHALGQAWVIRETQIDFFRPLVYNDCFELTVWLVEWRRVRGTRHFELKMQEGGEVVARGAQQVVVLDSQTMRPISPPEHLLEYYLLEDPRILPTQPFPRKPPPPAVLMTERNVDQRDLDEMEIVENTVYASYVEDAVTRALVMTGWAPAWLKAAGLAVRHRRFHIQYRSPAFWGDRLLFRVYLTRLGETGGEWFVTVRRRGFDGEAMRCVLAWDVVDRVTGEARPLPESLVEGLRDRAAASGSGLPGG
jgi:acyl-CoA thioesterase FadM